MEHPSGQTLVAQWISLPGASMKPHFEHKDADHRDEELGYGWGTFPPPVLNSLFIPSDDLLALLSSEHCWALEREPYIQVSTGAE